MTNMTEKQQYELACFETFRRASGLLRGWVPTCGDRPDIRASFRNTTIGVKVTRLVPQVPSRSQQYEQRGLQEHLIQHAQELHRRETQEHWEVHAHPNPARPLHRSTCERIAGSLMPFVTRSILRGRGYWRIRSEQHFEEGFPEEISAISAIRLPALGEPTWSIVGFGWVGETTHDMIQVSLDTKETKLRGFDVELQERWIVLVCDGTSMLEVHDGVAGEVYESSFDRGFVIDHVARFRELNIAVPRKPPRSRGE